jgi:hypothetical protein
MLQVWEVYRHTIHRVNRYIKHYEQIRELIRRGLDKRAIRDITGRSLKIVRQYVKLYYDLNSEK